MVGLTALLNCAAAGAPVPKYTWTVMPNSHPVTWNTSVVTIQFYDLSYDGKVYICTATNQEGSIYRVFTLYRASKKLI